MKKKIRVAHIIGKWLGGGVESVVMNYYRKINRNEIQFDFFCDEDSTDIPYKEIKSLGGNVVLIPPYQRFFAYQKELKRKLAEGNYEIVHSHINALSIFSLRAAKKAKVPVRIAHSHSTTNPKEIKKNIIKQLLRPFSKIYATDYMACSEIAGRWLFGNKVYDSGKVYILNNAIDLCTFEYNKELRNQKRQELNIDEGTLVIGHIGRFVPQKNHAKLIGIFKEIQEKEYNSVLLLVGQGPLENKIKETIEELGLTDRVIFLGQRKDVNEIYQAMDVFVLPSLYEGLGMVLIEGQAAGLPCVASSEVPNIAKVTENLVFESLDASNKQWANIILREYKRVKRKNQGETVAKAGYQITDEVKKLKRKYMEMIGR